MRNSRDFIYCSICLVTDVKMFEMNSTMLGIYNDLLRVKKKHKMHPKVLFACYECTHLLFKYWEFQEKCNTAYAIIWNCTAGTFEVTEECLKNIDREKSKLQSKLTVATESTNYDVAELKEESNNKDILIYNSSVGTVKSEISVNSKQKNMDAYNLNIAVTPIGGGIENSFIEKNKQEIEDLSIEEAKKNLIDEGQESDIENNVYIIEVFDSDLSDNKVEDSAETFIQDSIDLDERNENPHNIKEGLNVRNYIKTFAEDEIVSDKNNKKKPQDMMEGLENNERERENNSDIEFDIEDDELNTILARYPSADNINDDKECEVIQQMLESKHIVQKETKRKLQVRDKYTIDQLLKTFKKDDSLLSSKKRGGRLVPDLSFYENYVTVIELTPEEARNQILMRKESHNYKSCRYKCEKCFKGFNLLRTYENHMKLHSEEEGPYECNICKIRRSNKHRLNDHMVSCHKYKYVCKHCPYVSYNTTQGKNHVQVHKGEQYSCKVCGKTFRYSHSVHSHYRITHKLDFACELCGSTFGFENGLKSHKSIGHKREENRFQGPKCEDCNVHFTDERAYKRHLVLSSRHKVMNGCRDCGETFDDPSVLREHRKIHEKFQYKKYKKDKQWNDLEMLGLEEGNIAEDEEENRAGGDDGNVAEEDQMEGRKATGKSLEKKPSEFKGGPCIYCNTPLLSLREYKTHTLNDHPESELASKLRCYLNQTNICEICGKSFSLINHLIAHQRIHTGEKPYTCEECGKSFRIKMLLKTHMLTHTKKVNFSCHICDKALSNKSVLRKHLKYHSDKRPFKCTGCDKSFLHRCEMKKHAMHVHNKVPWPVRHRTDRKRKRNELET